MAGENLVEKAQVEYGIVNADQMSEEQLRAEMKAIDDQAASAEAASANESSDEPKGKALSKQNKTELLATAEAEGVEVSEEDTVAVLREKIAASRES